MTRPIPEIDKDIDAVVKAVGSSVPPERRQSPAAWQTAWDAFPDLSRNSEALWKERGKAQATRDDREHQAAMQAVMRRTSPRAKKCPTCGQKDYRAT